MASSSEETFFLNQSNVEIYWDLLHILDIVPDHIKPELGEFIMKKLNVFFDKCKSKIISTKNTQVENMKKTTSFKPKEEVKVDLQNESKQTPTVANKETLSFILVENITPNRRYEIVTGVNVFKTIFSNLPAYLLIDHGKNSGSLLDTPVFDKTPLLFPTSDTLVTFSSS